MVDTLISIHRTLGTVLYSLNSGANTTPSYQTIGLKPRIKGMITGKTDILDFSDVVEIEYIPPSECSLILKVTVGVIPKTKVFKCVDTPYNIRTFRWEQADPIEYGTYTQRGSVSYSIFTDTFQIIKKRQSPYGEDGQRLMIWRTVKTPLKFSNVFEYRD